MRNKLRYFALVAVLAAVLGAPATPPEAEAAHAMVCGNLLNDCLENGESSSLCFANYDGCRCAYEGVGCVV